MAMAGHGGEPAVGSSGALYHYRSHQHCESLSYILHLQSNVVCVLHCAELRALTFLTANDMEKQVLFLMQIV